MKAHTQEFKNEIKIFGRQINSKISYVEDGTTYLLDNENINSITPHFQSSILKSAMRGLEIDSNVEISKDTIVHFEFGVKVREPEGNDDGYDYVDFGDYIVKSVEKQEDTNSYLIQCYDFMLKSMKDYENIGITYPISIRDYIIAICNHLGLVFKNATDTFPNYDKMIPNELYLDSDGKSLDYTFRDVFDELSQVTASTICIDMETNKLELRYINDTEDIIDEEYLKDVNVNFGEKFGAINTIVLSRSAGSDNIYYPAILPENPIEYKIVDNQIMNDNNRVDYLPDIYNALNGLEYYINDYSSIGICYYDICDRYNVQVGNKTYSCVMFNDEIDITQGLEENIYTDMPEETNTDYTKADKTDRRINQTWLMVDKQNGIIESLVEKIVDVSEIKNGVGQVQLENAHEGILHKLSISGQISLLFPQSESDLYGYPLVPSDDLVPSSTLTPSSPVPYGNEVLYPSSTLYPRGSVLLIDDVEYTLDFDFLNYLSPSVFDEFVYKDGECWIIRRVGINSQGNKYALDEEVIEPRKPVNLEVKSDSIIKLKSIENAIYSVEYLLENEYTDIFATKVDVSSQITQTNNKIEATVKSVADDDGEITSGSILLALNKDESELKLEANKIGLEGYTTINGGFSIDENGSVKITSGILDLISSETIPAITLTDEDNNNNQLTISPSAIISTIINDNKESSFGIVQASGLASLSLSGEWHPVGGYKDYYNNVSSAGYNYTLNGIQYFSVDSDGNTYIRTGTYTSWSQASLEKLKKNIKKYNVNALDLIKKSDIYEFNYKEEKDEDKKHIGFVIGEGYKTPQEFISNNGNGIDTSSVIGIMIKAIQEQQKEIENLKKEMEELKNGKN